MLVIYITIMCSPLFVLSCSISLLSIMLKKIFLLRFLVFFFGYIDLHELLSIWSSSICISAVHSLYTNAELLVNDSEFRNIHQEIQIVKMFFCLDFTRHHIRVTAEIQGIFEVNSRCFCGSFLAVSFTVLAIILHHTVCL
jgi:hypothetical protein